jgi:hypothetical protein
MPGRISTLKMTTLTVYFVFPFFWSLFEVISALIPLNLFFLAAFRRHQPGSGREFVDARVPSRSWVLSSHSLPPITSYIYWLVFHLKLPPSQWKMLRK